MATAVRVSGDLVTEAKIYSKVDKRSITGQIEHWARIGKCAEENPDLTYNAIKNILSFNPDALIVGGIGSKPAEGFKEAELSANSTAANSPAVTIPLGWRPKYTGSVPNK